MPPRKVIAAKKTIRKRKKMTTLASSRKKSKLDLELTKLISAATDQAFKMKKTPKSKIKAVAKKKKKQTNLLTTKKIHLMKKSKTKKLGKKIIKKSPSISIECTEQTLSDTLIEESTSPLISSGDESQSDATKESQASIKHPFESHSSKLMDSELESNGIANKDETLSVNVGSTFKQGRYKAQRKLGYGAFSTVWLAWDQQENMYVALKIQNCSKDCLKAAQEEIKIHKEVAAGDVVGEKAVVKLLDHFEHNVGSRGSQKHICMVFEYLGDNLLTLIKVNQYKGLPLDIVKDLSKQILTGLNYLHKDLKIIHTDLKPENVLLMSPLDPGKDLQLVLNDTTTTTMKQHRSSTPAPPKMGQQNSDFNSQIENNKRNNNNLVGEKSSQPGSQVGSRPTSLIHNKKTNVNTTSHDNAAASSKMQIDEEQLASEPESLDRLAIDSDPDIARDLDMYNKTTNKKLTNWNNGTQQQVKFSTSAHNKKSPGECDSPTNEFFNIDIRCKIVDLGTACWTNKIFTDDIQTRPYRCPEVLLGCSYSTSADMWSFGCLVFELATGSILFDPRTGGSAYNRDEDHLAQITEILGPIPRSLASKGTHSYNYLTKNGELRRRKPRCHCPLYKLLVSEYKFNEKDAKELAGFLLPLLDLTPDKRPSADQCLHHPWLNNSST